MQKRLAQELALPAQEPLTEQVRRSGLARFGDHCDAAEAGPETSDSASRNDDPVVLVRLNAMLDVD